MAATLDADNPASPLHYKAAETALLLLDFQGFIIGLAGANGPHVLAKAVEMRKWALEQGVMVLHSIVDVNGTPPAILKNRQRLVTMLSELKNDRSACEEPAELAFSQERNEYVVLKSPGTVSALKSKGAMELLTQHGIKSLIVCGLSTSGAVLRTVIPGTDDGFVVTVVRDACSDSKEDVHKICMETLLPSRAHVVDSEQFLTEWEKATAA